MFVKVIASAVSTALSVGFMGLLPSVVVSPWQTPPVKVELKKVEGHPIAPEAPGTIDIFAVDDDADDLQTAFDILSRLKGERLAERHQQLNERAVKIYRDAITALEKGDESRSKSLATAARRLAEAVDLARKAQRTERSDPELPPPPRRARIAAKLVAPAPPMPPPLGDAPQKAESVIRYRTPDGRDVEKRMILGERVVGFPKTIAKDVIVEVRGLDEPSPAAAPTPPVPPELPATPDSPATRPIGIRGVRQDPANEARADLQRAYDKIKTARENDKSAESKFYLDAARDLYNAARRDALAARFDRARELARAAEALTLVPKHLAAIKDSKGDIEPPKEELIHETLKSRVMVIEKDKDGHEIRKYEVGEPAPRVHFERKDGRVEVRVEEKSDRAPARKKEQRRIRVEAKEKQAPAQPSGERPKDDGPSADASESVVGIGVALRFEDDGVFVQEILPGGPAASDGRIKTGDRIVGVEKDGKTTEFAGKSPESIVKELRGEEGSKVRIVVANDSDERKTLELVRRKLSVRAAEPAPPAEIKDEDKDDHALVTPPRQKGDALVVEVPLNFGRIAALKHLNLEPLEFDIDLGDAKTLQSLSEKLRDLSDLKGLPETLKDSEVLKSLHERLMSNDALKTLHDNVKELPKTVRFRIGVGDSKASGDNASKVEPAPKTIGELPPELP